MEYLGRVLLRFCDKWYFYKTSHCKVMQNERMSPNTNTVYIGGGGGTKKNPCLQYIKNSNYYDS